MGIAEDGRSEAEEGFVKDAGVKERSVRLVRSICEKASSYEASEGDRGAGKRERVRGGNCPWISY